MLFIEVIVSVLGDRRIRVWRRLDEGLFAIFVSRSTGPTLGIMMREEVCMVTGPLSLLSLTPRRRMFSSE